MDWNDDGALPIMGEASFCIYSVGEIQKVLFGDLGVSFQHCVVYLVFFVWFSLHMELKGALEFSHGEVKVYSLGLGVTPWYILKDFLMIHGCWGFSVVFRKNRWYVFWGGYGIVWGLGEVLGQVSQRPSLSFSRVSGKVFCVRFKMYCLHEVCLACLNVLTFIAIRHW